MTPETPPNDRKIIDIRTGEPPIQEKSAAEEMLENGIGQTRTQRIMRGIERKLDAIFKKREEREESKDTLKKLHQPTTLEKILVKTGFR